MRRENEIQYEKELIAIICCTAEGIGPTTAGAIAEHFESLQDFLSADRNKFLNIKNAKGRQILSDEKISKLVSCKKEIVSGRSISETWVYFLSRCFIRNQVDTLNAMVFDDLDINPFLAKALDLHTPEDIIRFNMYQSVTRSVVTSWGSLVEKMIKYSGCEPETIKIGIKGREPDLVKIVGGKTYCFQIKSGPNTMNVDMVESLNRVMEELEKKGYIGLLGMTYGRREKISGQIIGNLHNAETRTKIGRELWDFISESVNYHKKVIQIIELATKEVLKKSGSSEF